MVLFNGTLAIHGSLFYASWIPHLTGTFAALLILAALRPARAQVKRPPLWAYLGGISGGITVILTSATLNSTLALSGTIALGLAGQVLFGLYADGRGLFGLPQKTIGPREWVALALILLGSCVLIFFGGAA